MRLFASRIVVANCGPPFHGGEGAGKRGPTVRAPRCGCRPLHGSTRRLQENGSVPHPLLITSHGPRKGIDLRGHKVSVSCMIDPSRAVSGLTAEAPAHA